jgi:enoyl-CoA hydratase/carnithine racemase
LGIALTCDLRFGAEGTYQLGLPEVTLGFLPGNGGTQRLSAIVGPNKALELMISGVRLSPEEAHRLGILNRLPKSSELAGRTREFAKTLAGSATARRR